MGEEGSVTAYGGTYRGHGVGAETESIVVGEGANDGHDIGGSATETCSVRHVFVQVYEGAAYVVCCPDGMIGLKGEVVLGGAVDSDASGGELDGAGGTAKQLDNVAQGRDNEHRRLDVMIVIGTATKYVQTEIYLARSGVNHSLTLFVETLFFHIDKGYGLEDGNHFTVILQHEVVAVEGV